MFGYLLNLFSIITWNIPRNSKLFAIRIKLREPSAINQKIAPTTRGKNPSFFRGIFIAKTKIGSMNITCLNLKLFESMKDIYSGAKINSNSPFEYTPNVSKRLETLKEYSNNNAIIINKKYDSILCLIFTKIKGIKKIELRCSDNETATRPIFNLLFSKLCAYIKVKIPAACRIWSHIMKWNPKRNKK